MKKLALAALAYGALFFTNSVFGQLTFDPPTNYAMGINRRVEFLDADQDGDLDMFTPSSAGVTVRENNGAGVFGAPTFYLPGVDAMVLTFADVNNDTYIDVVASEWTTMHVLYNDPTNVGSFIGGATFGLPSSYPLDWGVKGGFESKDINGDGLADIVINASTETNLHIQVFMNTLGTPGLLVNTVNYPVSNALSSHELQLEDINADGKHDIIMTIARHSFGTPVAGFVAFLIGNGDGTFQPAILRNTSAAIWETGIEVADMDGVAPIDVIITTARSNDIRINHDITNLSSSWSSFTTSGNSYGIDIEDMDGDGDNDVIAAVYNGSLAGVQIHYNNGSGLLNQSQRLATGANVEAQAEDLNGDGLFDITAGRLSNLATVWLQQPPPVLYTLSGTAYCTDNCSTVSTTPAPFQDICITDGTNNYTVTTNALGQYSFPFADATMTYTITACAPVTLCGTLNYVITPTANVGNLNFQIFELCDVEYTLVGLPGGTNPPTCLGGLGATPCPGFSWSYCFEIRNNSCAPAHLGNIRVILPDMTLQAQSMTTPLTLCSGGTLATGSGGGAGNLTFNNITIPPGDCVRACFDVLIDNSPIDLEVLLTTQNDPCGSGGGGYTTQASQDYPILCSCDPNYKVGPEGCGDYHQIEHGRMNFRINFGNIGTGPAYDVLVVDMLHYDLDYSTFVIEGSSHGYSLVHLNTTTGKLEVHFDGINLAPGAQGHFDFSIMPDALPASPFPGVPPSLYITNVAEIFFDNNPSIYTNYTANLIIEKALTAETNTSCETIYIGYPSAQCVDLSVMASGGYAPFWSPYTYLWSTGETTDAITVCPTQTTTYTVTVTDEGGCSVTREIIVYVTDVRCGKNLSKVMVCHNGNTICVSPNAVAAHLAHGDKLGSCSSPGCEEEKSLTDESAHAMEEDIHVYPNPTTGELTIEMHEGEEIQEVRVIDLNGRVVLIPALESSTIDISELTPGAYIIEVITETDKSVFKIIKE